METTQTDTHIANVVECALQQNASSWCTDFLAQLDTEHSRLGWVKATCVPLEIPPVSAWIREWHEYYIDCPGIKALWLSGQRLTPVKGNIFRLCFENQVGLAHIKAEYEGHRDANSLCLLIISNKHADAREHLAFSQSLIDDLYERAARLPFAPSATTMLATSESLRIPSRLFVLYFLRTYAQALIEALQVIQRATYRTLTDDSRLIETGAAAELDADVLLDVLQSPQRWISTRLNTGLSDRQGRRYVPSHVWQRCPYETCDNPENRFVVYFVKALEQVLFDLQAQRWWPRLGEGDRQSLDMLRVYLQGWTKNPAFADVGPMRLLPFRSQVLLRRDGYRELLQLWRLFHLSRHPLYDRIEQAISLRDVATLYEVWGFYWLIDRIKAISGFDPKLTLILSDETGLEHGARAVFADCGVLEYNRGFARPNSYSVLLRPDYTWHRQGHRDVALDAKFRLDRLASLDQPDNERTAAKHADLYKMHTYRDALKLRAAVALYPGDSACFYGTDGAEYALGLENVLFGNIAGVGALPMRVEEKE